jgi:hypothetical protein
MALASCGSKRVTPFARVEHGRGLEQQYHWASEDSLMHKTYPKSLLKKTLNCEHNVSNEQNWVERQHWTGSSLRDATQSKIGLASMLT